MLKFLIPLLLVSTVALATPAHKTSQLNASPSEHTNNLNPGKCSLDVDSYLGVLKEQGFQPLLESRDIIKKNIRRVIWYSFKSNEIAALSYVSSDDKDETKPFKVCLENVSNEPNGFGETFRDFVIHQKMDDMDEQMKEMRQYELENRKKHHEPDQGPLNEG